ncbi:FAD/NAD(P)-binding protein [Microbulbifer magnicolonia]|uniref:FAD/NAD(P)-binding protein n=1 Tax=Microbulbifer magnicolonia TaxID=3109744 RepID=UPI002B40D069|nr:FAD/NAD(P)-binding protein [Microbulbifer sp. GG15]
MIPLLYRIEHRQEEYPGTFTLQLSMAQGRAVADPEAGRPGQFNMLYAFGAGEVPISVSGPVSTDGALVHTIRTQGLVTRALQRLGQGEQLGVRGPFGCGWPLERIRGRDLLIIAGGLGLAPLRPVVYKLLQDEQGARRVRLFYGARRPQERLYRRELTQWAQSTELVQSVDHADSAWPGHIGVITDPLAAAQIDTGKALAFVCGPEIMMRFCIQTLIKKGLPESAIYLSMERNMKCATGHCGHCQWGPNFICKDGPVFCYRDIHSWLRIRAL